MRFHVLGRRGAPTLAAVTAAALVAVLAVVPSSAAPRSAPSSGPAATGLAGLKVLLTNDDSARGTDVQFGTNGKGLYELRAALCDAGADVLVVAPWNQQSGASARMTVPGFSPVPLTVQAVPPPATYAGDCVDAESAGAVFGVCLGAGPCVSDTASASPADAVHVALSRFASHYWAEGPDVVLSGTNFGHNVGTMLNHSGTVGAAVTAHEYDVPAIALSAEVPFNLEQIPFVPFTQTAHFAVDLVERLLAADRLTPGLLLNVNHPFLAEGEEVVDAVTTVAGDSSDIGLVFGGDVPATGGTYQLTAGSAPAETRENADTTALAENRISVTQLDADWTLPDGEDLMAILDGRPGTPGEPEPPTVPDRVSSSLIASATPQRVRTRPYATALRGRLVGAIPASACTGRVQAQVAGTARVVRASGRVARKTVRVRASRSLALRPTDRGCRFSGRLVVTPHRAALANRSLRGRVRVRVHFAGSPTVEPARTATLLRLG